MAPEGIEAYITPECLTGLEPDVVTVPAPEGKQIHNLEVFAGDVQDAQQMTKALQVYTAIMQCFACFAALLRLARQSDILAMSAA